MSASTSTSLLSSRCVEIYARYAQIYHWHSPGNLHPNAAVGAWRVGQYAGQHDGQDVYVVSSACMCLMPCLCMCACVCWRIRFLMFWGLALKNALPSGSASSNQQKTIGNFSLFIYFLFFFCSSFFCNYAVASMACKAIDEGASEGLWRAAEKRPHICSTDCCWLVLGVGIDWRTK